MSTLTVTAKGQMTLKKDLLEHLGVAPGQKVSVEKLPDGRIEVRAAPKGDISQVFGILHDPNGPVFTIEEINDAIEKGWAGEK
jgi:AbrB family looped-hinge helix DNA binding protein